MPKYLLLKHYRGGPAPVADCGSMDQWTPAEINAHIQYMQDFAVKLQSTGEYVEDKALSPDGTFVRYDGEGKRRRDHGEGERIARPHGEE